MKLLRKKADPGRQRVTVTDNSASSFSYTASRRSEQAANVGRNDRREQKRVARGPFLRFWLQRSGMIILLVAIVICLVSLLSLSSSAKVLPLESGQKTSFLRNQATYQAAADKILASSIWNRNKLTINTSGIDRQMVAQFPELASASVSLPLVGHRPVVYLQPNQAAVLLLAHNGSFVLDTNGKALVTGDQLPAGHKLPQITDESGLDVQLNHQILTPQDISFIQTIVAQLAAKHITVSTMNLPAASSELDVHIAGQPYLVKFNLQNDDARQQVGTYLATLAQLQKQHVTPAHYIDVRVDGRAYYQ